MKWTDDFVEEFSVSVDYPNGVYQEWTYDCTVFSSLASVKKNLADDFPKELAGVDNITVTIDQHNFATVISLDGLYGDKLADYIIGAIEVFADGN